MGRRCFFVKKSGPFLNAGCIMYSISIFYILHFTYSGAGCIRTQRTPAYGHVIVCAACVKIIRALHAGRALERGHGI